MVAGTTFVEQIPAIVDVVVSGNSADAIRAPIPCLLAANRRPSVASNADMNERR